MPLALSIAALVLAFVAASGFLLGQLFFGQFSGPASVAGMGGLAAACGAVGLAVGALWAPRVALWAGVTALAGVAADVAHYYRVAAIAGNYYGWFMVGPFAACAAFVALVAWRRLRPQAH